MIAESIRAKFLITLLCGLITIGRSRQLHNVVRRSTAEKPGVSIAFAIDNTGSMSDDIKQVRIGTETILNYMLDRKDYPIENIVLSVFNDPGVSPVIVSKDHEVIRKALNAITVYGGGDCPELSMSGILRAIEASLPNSYVYVFTDASAKDIHLSDKVLELSKSTGTQVTFVLTGECGSTAHKGYQIYEKLAEVTKGQIFRLGSRHEVGTVLKFISDSLDSRRLPMEIETMKEGAEKVYHIDVEPTMTAIAITVSGPDPEIEIRDPSYKIPVGVVNSLELGRVKARKLENPTSGRWYVKIKSSGPHKIEITTITTMSFDHGFATHPATTLKDTFNRPMKGEPTYLLVTPTTENPAQTWTPTNAQIVGVDGKVHEVLTLVPLPDDSSGRKLFRAPSFVPPDGVFDVVVNGFDKDGNAVHRRTKTGTESGLPETPKLVGAPNIKKVAMVDKNLDIDCEITGVPIHVVWMKNGTEITEGGKLVTSNGGKKLRIVRATFEDIGQYVCVGDNSAGKVQQTFDVDINGPPVILEGEETVELNYFMKERFEFSCTVTGRPEPRLTWYKDSKPLDITSGTVVIPSAQLADAGDYICMVTGSGETKQKKFSVTVKAPPQLLSKAVENISIKDSNDFELVCDVMGFDITITWKKDDVDIEGHSKYTISEDRKRLYIPKSAEDDSGAFSCVAENKAGRMKKMFHVDVYELPRIEEGEATEKLSYHTETPIQLNCTVHGRPHPTITWYQNGYVLPTTSAIISIPIASINDGGDYVCAAENIHGSTQKPFEVTVLAPAWTEWQPWSRCTRKCGEGFQLRFRLCLLPALREGDPKIRVNNHKCSGAASEKRRCTYGSCPVNGGWTEWSKWSECSVSCGGGKRFRYRNCKNPAPANGGKYCDGSPTEKQSCNSEPCSVDGQWSDFSPWSACSVSCGRGSRVRSRKCDNPAPAYGGATCIGRFKDEELCDNGPCPVNGGWSEWRDWTVCTAECGRGYRIGYRFCNNPVPKNKGRNCFGRSNKTETCLAHPCIPKSAILHITGMVNGSPIKKTVPVDIVLNRVVTKHTLDVVDNDLLQNPKRWFPYYPIILSSLQWLTAKEIGDSTNGFTLTLGRFKQYQNITFSGRIPKVLNLKHTGRETNNGDDLVIDVEINGQVPKLLIRKGNVNVEYDVQADFIQIDEGVVYSSGEGLVKTYKYPYTTESIIKYDRSRGYMAFKRETLSTDKVATTYTTLDNKVNFRMDTSIAGGAYNTCPEGYYEEAKYCSDINECVENMHKCSDVCSNLIGSYQCSCPEGFALFDDRFTCQPTDVLTIDTPEET